MAAFADSDDVAAGWRPLSSDEVPVAETLCERASAMLRTSVLGVDARIAADEDYGTVVVSVVSEMVKRVLVNPECRRQDGVDDASWTLDQAVSTGALYISEQNFVDLRREVHIAGTPAYVISLGG